MNSLPRIIGPAPSEVPLEVFIYFRLKAERERVSASLEAFRLGAVPSWQKRKARKAKPTQAVKRAKRSPGPESLLTSLGLTLDEVKAAAEEALREARSNSE